MKHESTKIQLLIMIGHPLPQNVSPQYSSSLPDLNGSTSYSIDMNLMHIRGQRRQLHTSAESIIFQHVNHQRQQTSQDRQSRLRSSVTGRMTQGSVSAHPFHVFKVLTQGYSLQRTRMTRISENGGICYIRRLTCRVSCVFCRPVRPVAIFALSPTDRDKPSSYIKPIHRLPPATSFDYP
jgi:hypothetical protein